MNPFVSFVGEQVKPFTPEEAKEIVMTLQKPVVFSNMTFDWPVLHWNVTHLASLLAGKKILFRIGRKDTGREVQPSFSFLPLGVFSP